MKVDVYECHMLELVVVVVYSILDIMIVVGVSYLMWGLFSGIC